MSAAAESPAPSASPPRGAPHELGTRELGRLARRCLGLLRPVRRHLLALAAGYGALALLFFPLGVFLFDLVWTNLTELVYG